MDEILEIITNYVIANYHKWLIVLAILLMGYLVIRTTDRYITRLFDRVDYDRTLELLFQRTIKAFLWIVVLILALANAGFDVSGFLAGLGVMISHRRQRWGILSGSQAWRRVTSVPMKRLPCYS